MLTEAQKDVKIAYLEQENNQGRSGQVRSALLNYQSMPGEVTRVG